MFARVFSLLFVGLVIFGAWYQQTFMQVSSAEFEAQMKADKKQTEILSVRPFTATQYVNGKLRATGSANEAKYINNGKLIFQGNVVYEDYDEDGTKRLTLTTVRAQGQVEAAGANSNASFFDKNRKLELVYIPTEVSVTTQDDVMRSRDVEVDLIAGEATTDETVVIEGPGRRITGKGLRYVLSTQEFKVRGEVDGVLTPQRKVRKGREARPRKAPANGTAAHEETQH